MDRAFLRYWLSAFCTFASLPASAAVCTDVPTAINRMSDAAGTGARAVVNGEQFSVIAWIRPAELSVEVSSIFEMTGALEIHLLGAKNRGVRARVLGEAEHLEADALADLQNDEWVLLVASFDRTAALLHVWIISQSQSISHASATLPEFTMKAAGNPAIGSLNGLPAMLGVYGIVALRNHTVTEQDVLDVWNARRHYAPFDLDNTQAGGSMNGSAGCVYMFNHAVTTNPINHAGGHQHDIAAVIGEPSTRWNFHIYDALSTGSESLRVVRLLSEAHGFVNCSPYDAGDDFFLRPVPTLTNPLPEPHYVAGDAPLLRELAAEPKQLLKVMVSANSRAVMGSDGSATGNGNYAHGFIALNEEQTAGIINSPARLVSSMPWFGFDTSKHAPYFDGATEIASTNFSRFWTGSFRDNSRGPGAGIHLQAGERFGTYIMRCGSDGMIEADEPLVIEAYLLRFPGASDIEWVPNMHSRQGEPGADFGEPAILSLDTQEWSHTLGESDSVPASDRIILAGDHAAKVRVNDAVQTGLCISLVSSVTYDAEAEITIIDFEHGFSTLPQQDAVLRFGPWGYEKIHYEWPGLEPESEKTWRGLRVSTLEGGGPQGAIIFGYSAWRPNVNGYVFGTAGWSGNGYWRQIDRAFFAGIDPWMAMLAPDAWLQMFAQQGSSPSTINAYKQRIRSALPGIEIAWMGDCVHQEGGVSETWQHYILNNAVQQNVIAMTLVQDDRVGTFNAMLVDGLRSDANHLTARGNLRLAEIWTEMLLTAAIDPSIPVHGDLSGDGSVGVPDLLILLGAWGPCADAENCPADLDGSGEVGVPDLLILLGAWG